MTKKQREAYNKKRRIRSATVYNAWFDPKLADKVKSWSDERIYNELGIIVGNRNVTRKQKPKTIKGKEQIKTRQKNFVEAKKYALSNYGETGNINDIYVSSKRGLKVKKIYASIDSYMEAGLPYDNLPEGIKRGSKAFYKEQDKRIKKWASWAKGEKRFPVDMIRKARAFNRKYKEDYKKKNPNSFNEITLDSNVGWGVLYQAYIMFEKPEKFYAVDYNYTGELYTVEKKL